MVRSARARWAPGRQLQQPEGVGHRGPALAHPGRHLLVGQAELVDELLVGGGLLQGVEVDAVEVLDQRLLQAGHIVGHLDEDGDGLEPGPAGGPPAPLPRDELVAVLLVLELPDQHRLEQADLADGGGQRPHGLLVEMAPGLVGVGPDVRDRHDPE